MRKDNGIDFVLFDENSQILDYDLRCLAMISTLAFMERYEKITKIIQHRIDNIPSINKKAIFVQKSRDIIFKMFVALGLIKTVAAFKAITAAIKLDEEVCKAVSELPSVRTNCTLSYDEIKEHGKSILRGSAGSNLEVIENAFNTMYPDFGDFIIRNVYGVVLGEDCWVGYLEVELCAIASSCSIIKNHPDTIENHIACAINRGATESMIMAAINIGEAVSGNKYTGTTISSFFSFSG